jgi:hypothetical protein
MRRVTLGLIVLVLWASAGGKAQVLLDRVVARVTGVPIMLSDVRAALGMGLIVAGEDELPLAVEQLVQRTLLLQEVERFPPPEPTVEALAAEEARLRARIGSAMPTLAARTGLDSRWIQQAARGTLRIRGYLDQRFGDVVQVSDEDARTYYTAHPDEFRRDGVVPPFESVQEVARGRAAAERRQTTIDAWLLDLRDRADVLLSPASP